MPIVVMVIGRRGAGLSERIATAARAYRF